MIASNRAVFRLLRLLIIGLMLVLSATCTEPAGAMGDYNELLKLYSALCSFERPPMRDGARDYTAETFSARYRDYLKLRARLDSLDPTSWTVKQQVDWHIVRAEMNGFDFNHRVLQPWARDPAFYQSIWMARAMFRHMKVRHTTLLRNSGSTNSLLQSRTKSPDL